MPRYYLFCYDFEFFMIDIYLYSIFTSFNLFILVQDSFMSFMIVSTFGSSSQVPSCNLSLITSLENHPTMLNTYKWSPLMTSQH